MAVSGRKKTIRSTARMITQSRIRCVRVITSSSKKAGWHIRQVTGMAFTGIVEVKPPP